MAHLIYTSVSGNVFTLGINGNYFQLNKEQADALCLELSKFVINQEMSSKSEDYLKEMSHSPYLSSL
jgi:hypothetical protein